MSSSAELVSTCVDRERFYLESILAGPELNAVFQPIISTQPGAVLGYEGLVRGPADSPLHNPVNLFRSARVHGLTFELEYLCCHTLIERFSELQLPGKLFLNISPAVLVRSMHERVGLDRLLAHVGLAPDRVVFELTEQHAPVDNQPLRAAIAGYRAMGIQVAIDDLGEGFSSLRRWFELRPEYIKIDKFFIHDVDTDSVKQQFVRSIRDIAHMSNGIVVAEGVETRGELQYLVDSGISCCQGYYIDRPQHAPAEGLAEGISTLLGQKNGAILPKEAVPAVIRSSGSAYQLLRLVPTASPDMTNNQVSEIFVEHPDLHTVPIVSDDVSLGVITRTGLIDRFARPYQRELFGNKPCLVLMDDKPLMVDKDTSLPTLSHVLVEAHSDRLVNDFVITDSGRYLGIGTSHDLLRALTELQISTAKYANPLTQLPGNVLIDQHIEHLLRSEVEFCACYADLDHFKPFNDVFGYKRGDDLIQLTGQALNTFTDRDLDFLGHIGGDDFLILFCSQDWEARCQKILDVFPQLVADVIRDTGAAVAHGYYAEDRQGNRQHYAFPSLSLGAVAVAPSQYASHHQVALAAAMAKSQSKKIKGDSLFVERRRSP